MFLVKEMKFKWYILYEVIWWDNINGIVIIGYEYYKFLLIYEIRMFFLKYNYFKIYEDFRFFVFF